MKLINKIKDNEKSVLETFQEEIPSIYYSDKSEKEFNNYKKMRSICIDIYLSFRRKCFQVKI